MHSDGLGFDIESESIILKVIVNSQDKGDFFVLLGSQGDIFVSRQDLQTMGIVGTPQNASVTENGDVSLKSLAPLLEFEIDENEASLDLVANPQLLESHISSFARQPRRNIEQGTGNSAFLNYSIHYNFANDSESGTVSLPWELGARLGGYSLLSKFSYKSSDTDSNWVRLTTSLTKDDVESLRRYVIGDFTASSGTLGSTGNFGGISVSRKFSLNPYFVKVPQLNLLGEVSTPSEVEIYINDHLVRREHLAPGEFKYLNLPGHGSGRTTLVIKDAFGNEQRYSSPFYLSSKLLKPGVQEYSYNLGLKRTALGQESFEYDDLAFLAFHNCGASQNFTLGVRAEVDKDLLNVGTRMIGVPGALGEFDLSLAYSLEQDISGYGALANYTFPGRRISGGLSVKYLSENFATLTTSENADNIKLSASGRISFYLKRYGSFSTSFSMMEPHSGESRQRIAMIYQKNLWSKLKLAVSADRTWNETVEDRVFVSLTIPLRGRKTVRLSQQQTGDGAVTHTASFQRNQPLGPGLGYRFQIKSKQSLDSNIEDVESLANLEYHGSHGNYVLNHVRQGDQDRIRLSASGGVAFINRSVYLTRPIRDSFALVHVGGLAGVDVYASNQYVGKTDSQGEIIVPSLISYYDNSLRVKALELPVNYGLVEPEKHVSLPYRSGTVVGFNAHKIQAFIGHMFVMEGSKKRYIEYANMSVIDENTKIETVTGQTGEFYLENLSAGTYRVVLEEAEDASYLLTIEIPKSEEMVVELGGVNCGKNRIARR